MKYFKTGLVLFLEVICMLCINSCGFIHNKLPFIHRTAVRLALSTDEIGIQSNMQSKRVLSSSTLVTRIQPKQRLSLRDISAGGQLRGRIISFTKFGMYVDVGAVKDGLVHIKDVSSSYFVQDLSKAFSPGQDIDTWVKFVDPENGKLGLQLFPLTESGSSLVAKAEFTYDDLYETQRVEGTVVKSSVFGVYVSITNAGHSLPLAYLHKRKMLISKKQLKFKPFQIHPIGSNIECYIYSIDKQRHRVELTTYDPIEWDSLIPETNSHDKQRRDSTDEAEDDAADDGDDSSTEVPKYSSMTSSVDPNEAAAKHSKRGRQNTVLRGSELRKKLQTDDDAQFEPKAGSRDKTEYFHSEKGIKQLLQETGNEQYMQKVGSGSGSNSDSSNSSHVPILRTTARVTASILDRGVEVPMEELFDQLKNKQSKVTVQAVTDWTYMRAYMERHRVDESLIRQLMRESGSPFGSLNVEQFDIFMRKLAQALSKPGPSHAATKSSNTETDTDTDTDATVSAVVADGPLCATMDSDVRAAPEADSQVFDKLFQVVSQGKPAISLEDIFDWEFIKSFIRSSDDVYKPQVNASIGRVFYKQADKKNKCINNSTSLKNFIDDLCEVREKEIQELHAAKIRAGLADKSTLEQSFDASNMKYGNDNVENDEALKSTYETLTDGKKTMNWDQLIVWELVQLLLTQNYLTIPALEKKVAEFGGSKENISLASFDRIVDYLVYLYSFTENANRELKLNVEG